jgi:hypothetical protein
MAEDILNQLWQTWDLAWYRIQTEVSAQVVVVVALVAILFLFWLFLSPEIKNK